MRTLIVSLLTTAVVAGCISAVDDDGLPPGGLHFLAGEPLWDDPQNAPHAAFGWPTLSSPPPAGAPHWWQPIPQHDLPASLGAMEHVAQADGVTRGGGIALFGSLAVVPGYGHPSRVVDISDPSDPKVLSEFGPQVGGNHRGAAIIAYPDGRLVTVISMASVIDVWDITDPTAPLPLPYLEVPSHKVGVVPGTPIVYNARSGGGGAGTGSLGMGTGVTQIFDLTDPEDPQRLPDFENGYSCHHVYFWNDPANGKHRAVCAGIQYTQIWDTADPRDPQVIVSVPFGHGITALPSQSVPIVAFSHYAGLNQDGTILLVGDESGGGGLPPGCVAEVRSPVGSVSTPVGALWFYDVSDETDPRLLGWYSPLNDPRINQDLRSCTAHHGRLVPAEGRDVIAMSFYGAGVILLDFTDPALPVVIDQFADGTDTWEAWYYSGYLFTGDLARGMDVLRIV